MLKCRNTRKSTRSSADAIGPCWPVAWIVRQDRLETDFRRRGQALLVLAQHLFDHLLLTVGNLLATPVDRMVYAFRVHNARTFGVIQLHIEQRDDGFVGLLVLDREKQLDPPGRDCAA